MLHVNVIDLLKPDTYCLREKIPVAGHLAHFLALWEEITQADGWILEIIHQGYSFELTPLPPSIRNTTHPLVEPHRLSEKVEGLFRRGDIVPTPLDLARSGISWYPKGQRFAVNLKKFKPTPTQDLVYIGARFCTYLVRLYLPETRIHTLSLCKILLQSRGVQTRPAFLSLLRLMAEMLQRV